MNNLEKDLDKVYSEYGFNKKTIENDICLYLFEEGRYFGAEIIPLNQDQNIISECDNLRKQYAEIGYATIIRNVTSVEEASNELYKSFFSFA